MFKNNYEIKLTASLQKQNSRKEKKKYQEELANDAYAKFDEERPWEKAAARVEGRLPLNPAGKEVSDDGFDVRGDHGIGDIHLAARLGNVNRLRQLIEWEGENVNKTKWSGVTALHRAAAEGHADVIEYLIKKAGADPNAKTTFGWHTPLHFAARNGKSDACLALIECGATWQTFNKDRETPRHWARAGGHANMGRKLEQVVNQQASSHRKAKVKEMETMYEEKRRKAEEDRRFEEEEAKRLENELESRKLAEYQRSIEANSSSHTIEETNDHLHSKDTAQLPVNLPAIEYVKMGRRQVFIYNKLINRSVIVKPKRFGASSEHPSLYVTRNKVHMPGVTDTSIQAVGELSRHFRKTRKTTQAKDAG
jgi:ankyrin repeat protein